MARLGRRRKPSFDCPHCGAQVRQGAMACRECGSDLETGWGRDSDAFGGDPLAGSDADFDYEAYLDREFGGQRREVNQPRQRARIALGLALAAFLLWMLYPLLRSL